MIRSTLLTSCLLLAIVSVGCGGSGPDRAPNGESQPSANAGVKRLTIAVRSELRTVSANVNKGGGTGAVPGNVEVERLVNSPLTMVDAEGIRRPRLVQQVPTIENGLWKVSPDGRMETTWRLREDIRWHDGARFGAEDVVFTSRLEQDTEIAVFRTSAYNSIESVEALDSNTVLVKWKQPFIDADTMFTSPAPRHLLEDAYSTNKANLTLLPYWHQDFVGTGPYKLREWAPGSHALLDAFTDYVHGRPSIDEIVVRFIPDANTLFANILAGSVDLTMGRGISFDQGIQLREQWPEGTARFEVSNALTLYPQHLNPNPPILGDVRFRRALFHAIDRQQLVDIFMGGAVPIVHSVVPVRDREYKATEASIVRYEHDPRRAAQLLDGLGLTKGLDGFYRDSSNASPSIEIQAVITTEINDKTMHATADYWRRTGIQTVTTPIPIQRQQDREYRMARGGFDLAGGGSGWEKYHTSRTPLPENNFVGTNKTRYMTPEMDSLVERYFSTIPFDPRMLILGQIVHQLSDQVVVMGLFYDAEAVAMTKRLRNVAPDLSTATSIVWNVHEWELG